MKHYFQIKTCVEKNQCPNGKVECICSQTSLFKIWGKKCLALFFGKFCLQGKKKKNSSRSILLVIYGAEREENMVGEREREEYYATMHIKILSG